MDLGTRRTALVGSRGGEPLYLPRDLWPTIVGSPKPGVDLSGARYVFGNDAVLHKQHLNLTCPVREGIVHNMELCRKFMVHLRSHVDPQGNESIWTVVNTPADSTLEERRRIRQVLLGTFERVYIVPEPYLAALGILRDDSSDAKGITVSSALKSLVIDIGLQSTRICLLQKDFPEKNNLIRLNRGGTYIDEQVLSAAHLYPNIQLTPELVRSFKEEQGVPTTIYEGAQIQGSPNTELLNLVTLLRDACQQLLSSVVNGTQELVESWDASSIPEVAELVLVTGRSSMIPGLSMRLERLFQDRGLGKPRMVVPADYKRLVARGALHIAEALSEDEWETAEEEQRRQDEKFGPLEFRREVQSSLEDNVEAIVEDVVEIPTSPL